MALDRLIVTLLGMFGLRALRRMGKGTSARPGSGDKARTPQERQQQEALRSARRAARIARRINR
jgi:hypothetical protein